MIEIKAIIRREKVELVKQKLSEQGFAGLTDWHVMGRGKQKGVVIDGFCYDEIYFPTNAIGYHALELLAMHDVCARNTFDSRCQVRTKDFLVFS